MRDFILAASDVLLAIVIVIAGAFATLILTGVACIFADALLKLAQ